MKSICLRLWLRSRLALATVTPIGAAGVLMATAAIVGLAWFNQAKIALGHAQERLAVEAARPVKLTIAPVPAYRENLALFYRALGERRYAEQQVRTLFGVAAKCGIELRQGEYVMGYDRKADVFTYQVNLPVTGSYRAIWQFALRALRTIPFAALDDIRFQRDAIGDANVDAHLHITLYLAEAVPGAQP